MALVLPHHELALSPDRPLLRDRIVIPAIDANGVEFPIEKMAAHHAGQLHWAVSVFVFSDDEMLIQRRAQGKYHCGGLWANACCTHPHWREDLETSARRRIREELGAVFPLTPTAIIEYQAEVSLDMREHERVQVFRAEVDRARIVFSPNPEEVAQLRWARVATLQQEAMQAPERFAPWFRIYLERWAELGLD